MKKIIALLTLLLISIFTINAQDDKDFPALGEADLPGAKILQQKYFDGNALWGHIDGGADLYLEYGFNKLLFQEIEWNNTKLRVEYYRMNDTKAAFGIFSVSRFKCDVKDTLTKFICITKYQVQSALGRFYISIANEKGTDEAKNLSVRLFQIILGKSNEKIFILPESFNKPALVQYAGRIKLFSGILGIQNGLPLWTDYFENFSGYEIILLPVENNDGYLNYAIIKFAKDEDRIRFMRSVGVSETKTENRYITRVNGISLIVKNISESEINFYETVFNNDEIKNILGEK